MRFNGLKQILHAVQGRDVVSNAAILCVDVGVTVHFPTYALRRRCGTVPCARARCA